MNNAKEKFKEIFRESFYVSIVKEKRKIFATTYKEREDLRMFFKATKESRSKKYKEGIEKTLKEKNKNKDYIILHNPAFLEVTSATRELFDNLVPATDFYTSKDIMLAANAIIENNIKKIYFNASWTDLGEKTSVWHKRHKMGWAVKPMWTVQYESKRILNRLRGKKNEKK